MELEEQVTPVPRMELAQWRFLLTHSRELKDVDIEGTKEKIMALIQEESMSGTTPGLPSLLVHAVTISHTHCDLLLARDVSQFRDIMTCMIGDAG